VARGANWYSPIVAPGLFSHQISWLLLGCLGGGGAFLCDLCLTFASLVRILSLYILACYRRSRSVGNLQIEFQAFWLSARWHVFDCWNHLVLVSTFFEQLPLLRNYILKNIIHLIHSGTIVALFSHSFVTCSASIVALICTLFFMDVLAMLAPFLRPEIFKHICCCNIARRIVFRRILDAFWSPFGSILAPFGFFRNRLAFRSAPGHRLGRFGGDLGTPFNCIFMISA